MSNVKLLKASAGSGKTYQLAYEYVRAVIEQPYHYRHILAVTFTNKATEEMKRRILLEINELAKGKSSSYLSRLEQDLSLSPSVIASRAATARTKILHDYSHFAVLTIDKFFQQIIRSFIKELGIDLNFNLELQTEPLLSRASDLLIDDISINEELREWIMAFVEEKIDDNKRWDVKTGLMKLGQEVFSDGYKKRAHTVPSKAGLSKIVSKASARSFAVINSMKNNASKALEIIHSNNLEMSDFAYGADGVAGYIGKIANGDISPYGIRATKALESEEAWYAKKSPKKHEIVAILPQLIPLLANICTTYDTNVKFLNSTELLRANYRNFALLSDLSTRVEQICAEDNIMPISQTNTILNKLISDNDAPFIFEKVGNHFMRFMMDEFQDTSTVQWENFLPLLKNAVSQSNNTPVLIVGDVKQSIYRWRGGDWKILSMEVEREFRSVESIDLVTNYRSFRTIVEFNNAIIAGCTALDNESLNDALTAAREQGYITSETNARLYDVVKSAYKDHEQQASKEDSGGYVNITTYAKNESEEYVPPVIKRIEELQERGYRAGDIVILVRHNADGVKIANMLLKHKGDNPNSKYIYDVVTQEALTIGSAPIIGFIIAVMNLSVSTDQELNMAVYNSWLGRDLRDTISEEEAGFFKALRLKSLLDAVEAILIRYKLSTETNNIAYLQAFHEQVIKFSDTTISDIPLFVKWWDASGSGQSINVPPSDSAINIISIHKAKGLQYRAVLIPYCNWRLTPRTNSVIWADDSEGVEFTELGVVPIGYSDKKMPYSLFAKGYFDELVMSHVDNINLFYVAVTRAMEELHIMIPANTSKTSNKISLLVQNSLATMGGRECVTSDGDNVVEFGTPCAPKSAIKHSNEDSIFSPYLSYPIADRLKLSLNNQRYFDEDSTNYALSPRNYGVLMHKVFEVSKNHEEIELAVVQMQKRGEISKSEAEQLTETIARAFDNTLVSSWFDGSWESVRNESEIIIPQSRASRRPDRVITKDNQAVVIDYKFGLNRQSSYHTQMSTYIELLHKMGYAKVDGYIWYVSLNDVEAVTI